MDAVSSSIIVNAPLAVVYERWSRFEEFPKFMTGVLEVRRLENDRYVWRFELQGNVLESVSEITLRIPNQRIAWRTLSGAEVSGVAAFEPVEEGKTELTVSFKHSQLGGPGSSEAMAARLRTNLDSFKNLLESASGEGGDTSADGK